MRREAGGWPGVPQLCVRFVQDVRGLLIRSNARIVRFVRTPPEAHPRLRPDLRAGLALGLALGLGAAPGAGPAFAQVCSYPQLTSDVPQAFTGTPTFTRFAQNDGRWAAVAVKSGGSANWDVGLSTNSAPFANCVTFPVVASQQASGIDFVLGDFGAEGTGTYYAPIARASGSGGATVEWDSGARTVALGPNPQAGQNPPGLIDCWNVDLVAGTSYSILLFGDNVDDYRLYAFRRGLANSWRQKSDALVEVVSNLSTPPVLTAPATDTYALVVVNVSGSASPYELTMSACADPPDLAAHVSLPAPLDAPGGVARYHSRWRAQAPHRRGALVGRQSQLGPRDPAASGRGLPALRRRVPGGLGRLRAARRPAGRRPGLRAHHAEHDALGRGRPRRNPPAGGPDRVLAGLDVCAVDGATQYVVGGNDLVVRTFRSEMPAGVPVTIHVASAGPPPESCASSARSTRPTRRTTVGRRPAERTRRSRRWTSPE